MSDETSIDPKPVAENVAEPGPNVVEASEFVFQDRILNREERDFLDHFLRGTSLDQLAKMYRVSKRTIQRRIAPGTPLGQALDEMYLDRKAQLDATRDVLKNPKTPPSTRMAAVVQLSQLKGDATVSGSGKILTEHEIRQILNQRARQARETG